MMETPKKRLRGSQNPSHYPTETWQSIRSTQEFREVPTHWGPKPADCTRIVCMSDTHGLHREVAVPRGDVLIHAGDLTQTGELNIMADVVRYFRELAFPITVAIAGNHDTTLDEDYYQRSWPRFHRQPYDTDEARRTILSYMSETTTNPRATTKFYYLEDSSCTIRARHTAMNIYGSPWSPEFYDWAFNCPRGQPAVDIWSDVPTKTDVLVTHGPPLGRGDLCETGVRAGCYDLLRRVQNRVKPRLMIFGHIHEGYGTTYDGTTLYVNASSLDLEYNNVHPCIVIDLPDDPRLSPRVVQPMCDVRGEHLIAWFRQREYTSLAEALEQSGCRGADFPSENELLQTSQAYKSIKELCQMNMQEKRELRKGLLQLHAEAFE